MPPWCSRRFTASCGPAARTVNFRPRARSRLPWSDEGAAAGSQIRVRRVRDLRRPVELYNQFRKAAYTEMIATRGLPLDSASS